MEICKYFGDMKLLAICKLFIVGSPFTIHSLMIASPPRDAREGMPWENIGFHAIASAMLYDREFSRFQCND